MLLKKFNPKNSTTDIIALGKGVKLEVNFTEVETETEEINAVWVQVAREGDYPGYAGGEHPFAFEVDHFKQMITNIQGHPSYKVGEDGVGLENIIPWDFNHASELFPGAGNLPIEGAPAQAWTRDLKLAKDKDDKTCLMAYTLFLEPALTYIRDGKYQWSSVAVTFDAVHPETAENIGAYISSIALTNTPFIEGMEKLAASKFHLRYSFYEAAEDAKEAVGMMKQLFMLPETSTLEDIMIEVAKVATWIKNGNTPLGIDLEYIIGSMRKILGLPTLSTEEEVIDNASSIASRLIDEIAVASGVPSVAGGEPLDQISDLVNSATTMAKENEADMELIKMLAKELGVRESDDAVVAATKELIELRTKIMGTLKVEKDSNESILNVVEAIIASSTHLSALLTALGVEDVTSATAKVVTLTENSEELTKIKPEFDKMQESLKLQEEKMIETDVAEVMNSRNFTEDLKEPLLLFRKSNPEEFTKKYPKIEKPEDKSNKHPLLTKNLVVAPSGEDKDPKTGETIPASDGQVDLAKYPGRNSSERAINYIKATNPGSKDWKYEDLCETAFNFKNQANVVDSSNN